MSIAKALGLHVIASADTNKKRQIAKDFGADHVVDSTGDWATEAKNHTPDKRGVDVVIDPLGMISQSLKCIRWDGRLVVVGFAAGNIESIPTNRLLLKNVALSGLFWGQYAVSDPQSVVDVWDQLLAVIDEGRLRPWHYTEKKFKGIEEIPAAVKLLTTGTAWGKIVVDLDKDSSSKL